MDVLQNTNYSIFLKRNFVVINIDSSGHISFLKSNESFYYVDSWQLISIDWFGGLDLCKKDGCKLLQLENKIWNNF